VRDAIAGGLLASAHDCSDGGLCVALAESCIASDLGISADLTAGGVRLDRVLFAEGGSRIVVSVKVDQLDQWQAMVDAQQLPVVRIGVVTDQPRLVVRVDQTSCLDMEVERCRQAHSNALPRRIDGEETAE